MTLLILAAAMFELSALGALFLAAANYGYECALEDNDRLVDYRRE